MSTQRVGVASLLSALCIGVIACGGTQASSTAIGNQGDSTTPPPQPRVVIETIEDGQRLLPASANIYVGVDFLKLTQATVLEKYRKMMVDQMPGEVREFQAECGLDVMRDFDWLLVAMSDADSDKTVIVLKGNFTQTKIESCIDRVNSKGGSQTEISSEGDLRVYEIDGERMYAAWPSDSVMVVAEEKGRALLDDVVARKMAKSVDESVASDLAAVDTKAALWFAAQMTPSMANGLPVQDVTSMRMSVETGATIDIVFAADFASSTTAKEMHNQLQMVISMARGQPDAQPFLPIIDKLRTAQTDRAVSGNLTLTEADLGTIEAAAAGAFGGMP